MTQPANVGDEVYYRCNPQMNFTRASNGIRVCQANSTWTELPNCMPAGLPAGITSPCPDAPNVENAVVASKSFRDSEQPKIGDYAYYRCNPGYQFATSTTSSACRSDGRWSELPRCVRSQPADSTICRDTPQVNNAVIVSKTYSDSNYARIGDSVNFRCNPGYLLATSSNTTTCEGNSRWSELPRCTRIEPNRVTCRGIPNIKHSTEIDRDFCGEDSYPGSYAEFTCLTPYVLRGSNRITCQSNGEWSQPLPVCADGPEYRSCGEARPIANGQYVPTFSSSFSRPGDQVNYYCNNGYRLFGTSLVVCESSGRWSKLPQCQPIASDSRRPSNDCPRDLTLFLLTDIDSDVRNIADFLMSATQWAENRAENRVNFKIANLEGNKSVSYYSASSSQDFNRWVDENIKDRASFRMVPNDQDLQRLFAFARNRVEDGDRILFVTSSLRDEVSVANSIGELVTIRNSRFYVIAVGANTADPRLRASYERFVASETNFFRYISRSDQINQEILNDDFARLFLCGQSRDAFQPGMIASVA